MRVLPIVLFCFGAAALATAQPGARPAPLQIDLDVAAFQYDADASLVEVYLAFVAPTLPWVREAGEEGERFVARFPLTLALHRAAAAAPEGAAEGAVFADALELAFAVADTTGLSTGQYFVQQVRTLVAPGLYELEADVPAVADRPGVTLRRDVTVPDFADRDGRVRLSDLTLAASVRPSEDREHPLYKNGLLVQPNPNGLYGEGLPRIFYYAEAYGLDETLAAGEYTLLAYVAASNTPQPVGGLQQRTSRPVRETDVLVGAFDVSALPSGSYFLRLAVLDAANEAVAEQARRFFVFNPSVQRETVAFRPSHEESVFGAMSEEELDENLQLVAVVATARERRQIQQLVATDAKRSFLVEFWRQRDNDPAAGALASRRAFMERLQYVNDRYSTAHREGWRTERGRVVLRYGLPSSVNPRQFESGLLPHEVWEYDNIPGQGRAIFVFADRTGVGDHELLHSTVQGEINQPDWQSRIRR